MEFEIGNKVSLSMPLKYLKTADPMPMLRPPDLVSSSDLGEIVSLLPRGIAAVRFRRGTFLIPLENLRIDCSGGNEISKSD